MIRTDTDIINNSTVNYRGGSFMSILSPFLPVNVEQHGHEFEASVLLRNYRFGADGMLKSVLTSGKELLYAPVRLVGREAGEEMIFAADYDTNESAAFVSSRSDEAVTICAAMRSRRFIVDQKITISYDGSVDIAMTLMPAGLTVAEVFGTKEAARPDYRLESLCLEIPLKKDAVSHYSMYPGNELLLSDGTVIPKTAFSDSGAVSCKDMYFPFEALLWLGREECGLGFYEESLKGREIDDPKRVCELLHTAEGYILRVHLFDHHPLKWKADPADGCYAYRPISFRFGLMPTPVKPFPADPYYHNALHLDCFVKTPGNYLDYLTAENRFDRLKEKGVNTLILHEKWNRQQNCFEPSEPTLQQLKQIVRECHVRGIRVLTYFGYEISTLSADFDELFDEVSAENGDSQSGGWYRVPFQRAYNVCYNSVLKERLLKGIARVMDSCHTDGVYLDGTATPIFCMNERHGCRWIDENGTAQGTHPVRAVRDMFRELYEVVHSRGGYLSVHAFGCMNFTALPYIDLSWYGENLQFDFIKGEFYDVPLDYFRSSYTGRNMGVPVEFIAYEKRPVWNFENALAISLVHGILPRPNDIEGPLELMSRIWQITNVFPLDKSKWCPYWTNAAEVSSKKVKISYYRYTSVTGKTSLLVFISNISDETAENVSFHLPEAYISLSDVSDGTNRPAPESFDMEPYSFRILIAE